MSVTYLERMDTIMAVGQAIWSDGSIHLLQPDVESQDVIGSTFVSGFIHLMPTDKHSDGSFFKVDFETHYEPG